MLGGVENEGTFCHITKLNITIYLYIRLELRGPLAPLF